jgi:hypothetical protein
MNTLLQAVEEYLTLRRSLGFKLYKAGKLLPAFVKFMEERRASYITSKLALAWRSNHRPCSRWCGRSD